MCRREIFAGFLGTEFLLFRKNGFENMLSVICFQSKAVSGINWKCSTKLFSGTVILICFVPNVSPLKHFLTGGNSKKANKKLVMKFLKLTVQQKNITIGTSQAHMDLQGPFCSWVGEYFYTAKHFLSKGISKGFVFLGAQKSPFPFCQHRRIKPRTKVKPCQDWCLAQSPFFCQGAIRLVWSSVLDATWWQP